MNLSIHFVDNKFLREEPQGEWRSRKRGLGAAISDFAVWMRVGLCADHLYADGNTNSKSTPTARPLLMNVGGYVPYCHTATPLPESHMCATF